MKKLISIFLAVLLIISSTALAPVSAYSATKMHAADKILQIQKMSGFVPGQQAVVTGNCFAFVSAVCEKLYGVTYWNEILYSNFRADHSYTGRYYTVKTFTTRNTYPTSTDVENIISFFKNNAVPGDVMHYGAYTTGGGNGNTHTVMISSIDTEKMGIYHSNYETVDAGRNTCHVDYIYWDSFRKNPTSNEYTSSGHLKSMNSIFYNKMRSTGLGISLNRFTNYESKYYLTGVGVPELSTSRTSPYSIKVKWDKIKGADRYQVDYRKESDTSYTTVTSRSKSTSYHFKNLKLGTMYVFRVRAYIGNKWMKWSKAVKLRSLPPKVMTVRFAPDSKGLSMTWGKRNDITGVRIYRSTTQKGEYKLIRTITDNSVGTYLDKNVKYGVPYYYKFRRYIKSGNKEYCTTSYSKKGVYELKKPSVSYVSTSTTSVDFKLKANGKSDRFVYYVKDLNNKTIKKTTVTTSNDVSITGLKSCNQYNFYAAQRTDKGTGEYTCITFRAVPAKVIGLEVENVSEGLKLRYDTQDDVSGYVIYRSNSKKGEYERIAQINSKSTDTYLDSKIEYNKTYFYKVRAFDTYGGKKYFGRMSDAVSGKNFVGKAEHVRAYLRTPTSFKVRWDKTENATSYTLQCAPKNSKKWRTVGTTTKTYMVCSKVKLGTTYIFRVKASNKIGSGSYSGIGKRKAAVPIPAKPTSKNVKNGIRIYWDNKSYATGYYIYRSSSKNGNFTIVKNVKNNTTSAWTDKSVKYGKFYYYKVVCYKTYKGKTYKSQPSPRLTAIYQLDVPVIEVKKDGTTATVSWKACAGATRYTVMYAVSGGEYKSLTTTECSRKISGFKAGTQYKFSVRAESEVGNSLYCNAKFVRF